MHRIQIGGLLTTYNPPPYLQFGFRQADSFDTRYERQGLSVGQIFLLQDVWLVIARHLARPDQVWNQVEPQSHSAGSELILHPCLQT